MATNEPSANVVQGRLSYLERALSVRNGPELMAMMKGDIACNRSRRHRGAEI